MTKDVTNKIRRVYLLNGAREIVGAGNFYRLNRLEGVHVLTPSAGLRVMMDTPQEEHLMVGFYPLEGYRHDGTEKFLPLQNGYTIGLSVWNLDEQRFQISFRCIETPFYEDDKTFENDNANEENFIAIANIHGENKLVELTRDGSYQFLDESYNLHKIIYVVSSETLALQAAVEELEFLMNYSNASEEDFQKFFERHRDFILNDDYKDAHPHIVLSDNEDTSLIPDFVLEPIDQNALCDILELKLPSIKLFVLKKNRMHYSAAVVEACAQLRMYGQFFDDEKNRVTFQNMHPGLRAYRPKLFVIIGRQGKINPFIRRAIESDLPSITLHTYDEVLNRAKFKLEAMRKGILRKYFPTKL